MVSTGEGRTGALSAREAIRRIWRQTVPSADMGGRVFGGIAAVLFGGSVLAGCASGGGYAGMYHQETTVAPPNSTVASPKFPVADGVELLCTNGTGFEGNGSAAIAPAGVSSTAFGAIQDCPSSQFSNDWSVQVGWKIICVNARQRGPRARQTLPR
jgi:hypothetical protein